MSKGKHFVDVSHIVEHGLITYQGLPAPVICDHLSREDPRKHYAPGTEFHIGKIEMVANTGTYLDSPFHRYPAGADLSQLPLSNLADLDGIVVDTTGMFERTLGRNVFNNIGVTGRAVLVRTGWDAHWGTDQYFAGHPFLTEDAAELLVDEGVKLVGIDSYNIDDTADGRRPVHSILLGADIPIVEHLCGLQQLPRGGFKFFAVPVKVKGFGTFPVRAFAVIEG